MRELLPQENFAVILFCPCLIMIQVLFDSYVNIVDKHQKGEGERMRWVINIDKVNLNLVKLFLKAGTEIKHVKNMPPMMRQRNGSYNRKDGRW